MKVTLLAHTPDAEVVCAAAGNSCYSKRSSAEIAETIDPGKLLPKIVGMGHNSVLEHAVYTFCIEGVSRSLTHQLVRHRIASFSQQSQRYVSMDEAGYVTPHTVEDSGEAARIYSETMDAVWDAYRRLESLGIPAEDARYLLPNGCVTNITVTMNARELLHLFSLRCCSRAQWEVREMAEEMMRICKETSPMIFANAGPPCVTGPCPEGPKSCGNPRR